MLVQNQKPTNISVESLQINPTNDFDLEEIVLENFVNPIMQPMNQNNPVQITYNNQDIALDEFVRVIIGEAYNTNTKSMKDELNELFETALIRYEACKELTINEVFLNQSAKNLKLPFPTKTLTQVIAYTIKDDIIPSIKEIMAGQGSYDKLFTAIGFTARPNTLGVYFKDRDQFISFRDSFVSQAQIIKSQLSPEVNDLINQFSQYDLDVPLDCIQLRGDHLDQNNPMSFARLIHSHLVEYMRTNTNRDEYGILPFSLAELFVPQSLAFFNLEKHNRVPFNTLSKYYKDFTNGLKVKPKIYSQKKIKSLTKLSRSLNKLQNQAVPKTSKNAEVLRAKRVPFSTKDLTVNQIAKRVINQINKMESVNKSHNYVQEQRKTYNKPNRRDPDDPNKKGVVNSKSYKPDIHIYCDTSGSISEVNYQDAIKTCMAIARKLNINMYFTSFSTVLSKDHLLKLKNQTKKQCYTNFEKIAKVTGGTDYMPIWEHINSSKKRRQRLNIIITDFEYDPPNYYFKHPKNLIYLPCSKMDMDRIAAYAKEFSKLMEHVDPLIRKKILF